MVISLQKPDKSFDEASELYLSLAYAVAAIAHEGVINKDGTPYITHPLRLAARWEADNTHHGYMSKTGKIVALLHDVLEDTDVTIENLTELGFEHYIIYSLELLTRKPDAPDATAAEREAHYFEHIEKLASHGSYDAIWTKIYDLEDNMDVTRIKELDEWSLARTAKYHKAWLRLKAEVESWKEVAE